MAKFYKVSTKQKKSIYEYQTFKNDDETISFQTEEMYRWGYVVIKVEDGEELEDYIGDPNDENNEFEIDTFEDADVDDQCSFYFENVKGIDIDELDAKYEEGGWDYLIENYGEPWDFYKVFHGPLNVEDVTDEWQGK